MMIFGEGRSQEESPPPRPLLPPHRWVAPFGPKGILLINLEHYFSPAELQRDKTGSLCDPSSGFYELDSQDSLPSSPPTAGAYRARWVPLGLTVQVSATQTGDLSIPRNAVAAATEQYSRLGDRNLQTQDPGPEAKAGWVRCCGDTFSLWGGMLAYQLHSWHHVCQQETYGMEPVSTPEGEASCFLNFLGSMALCNLYAYTLLDICMNCFL